MTASSRGLLFMICLAFAAPAAAQLRCGQVFDDAGTAYDRLSEGFQRANENADFPALTTTEFLMTHYRALNARLDHYLIGARDRINSDVQTKMARMQEVNGRLQTLIETIQKTLASGGGLFRGKDGAVRKANELINEASFCRGRGETCSVELRNDLRALAAYHRQLEKFQSALAAEVKALDDLIAQQNNDDVLSPLIRQSQSLKVAQVTLSTQLHNHHSMISAAAEQLALFDGSLKDASRTLLVTSPHDKTVDKGLAGLNSDHRGTFNGDVEKFEPGAGVLVIDLRKTGRYELVGSTVKRILQNDGLEVSENKRGLLGSKVFQTHVTKAILTGCFGGLCTGSSIRLGHGLPTRALGEKGVAGELGVKGFNGDAKILGLNPLTKEFLIELGPQNHHWVPFGDLVAVSQSRPAPSIVNARPPAELKAGDPIIWVVRENKFIGTDGYGHYRYAPEPLGEGGFRSKRDQFPTDPDKHYDQWSGHWHKFEPFLIIETVCRGGLCPGDIVRYTDPEPRYHTRDWYAVVGFVDGKVYMQEIKNGSPVQDPISTWGRLTYERHLTKVDLETERQADK